MKFLLALLVFLSPALAQQQQDPAAMEQDLFRMVNAERAHAGLPQLRLDPKLVDAARAHSQLMADRKTLSHDLQREPDLSQRVASTGLRFNAVAENISLAHGSDQSSPAEVAHRGLMGSPPHRANIMNPEYNSIGIGVVRQGNSYYTTEDFATAYAAATTDDAETTVAARVNDMRRTRAMPALRVVRLDRLNAIACENRTNVQTLLQTLPSSRSAAVFTTWNLDQLPKQMIEMSTDQGLTAMSLHACTLPPAHGGSGGFKVAAVFF